MEGGRTDPYNPISNKPGCSHSWKSPRSVGAKDIRIPSAKQSLPPATPQPDPPRCPHHPQPSLCPERAGHRASHPSRPPTTDAAWPRSRSPLPRPPTYRISAPKERANKRHTPTPSLRSRPGGEGLAGAGGGGREVLGGEEKGLFARGGAGGGDGGTAGGLRARCRAACAAPAGFPTVAFAFAGAQQRPRPLPRPCPAPSSSPRTHSAHHLSQGIPSGSSEMGWGGGKWLVGLGDQNTHRAPGSDRWLTEAFGYSITFNLPRWKLLYACLITRAVGLS